MPQLTVRQAAERVGVSRQTMFRYIKEGKVSATLSHSGEKQIEVSELLRAFGSLQPETATPATQSNRQRQPQDNNATPMTVAYQIELERLKAQLELKNAELELARERIAELKSREHSSSEEKNRLLTLIEQQTRLLEAPQRTKTPSQKKPTTPALIKASAVKGKDSKPMKKAIKKQK